MKDFIPISNYLPLSADTKYVAEEVESLIEYIYSSLRDTGFDTSRIGKILIGRNGIMAQPRHKSRKLTPAHRSEILELCGNTNITYEEIAAQYDVSPGYISNLCIKAGYKRPRGGYTRKSPPVQLPTARGVRGSLTPDQRLEIAELCRNTDLTYKQIAARYGISASYVSNLCVKSGYKRARGGSGHPEPRLAPRRRRGKLTSAQRMEIIELCKDTNITHEEIAAKYGVSAGYISGLCIKAGYKRPHGGVRRPRKPSSRPGKLTSAQRLEILELCKDTTIPYREIGERYGVTAGYIGSLCHKAGIKRRAKQLPARKTSHQEDCLNTSLSYAALAEKWGVSVAEAYRRCKDAGYQRRRGSRRGVQRWRGR